jgi:hypothetical protein
MVKRFLVMLVVLLFLFTGCVEDRPDRIVISEVGLNEEKNELSVKAAAEGTKNSGFTHKTDYRITTFERNCGSKDEPIGLYTIKDWELEKGEIYEYNVKGVVDYVKIKRLPNDDTTKKMWTVYGEERKGSS